MADKSKDEVDEWVKALDDITGSMRDISRLQTGVIKGFTEITKTSTATGQAWTATARFFSGTGFWKIQNKIKSVSNLLQAAQKIEAKKIEQEQKMLEQVVKREKATKNIIKTQAALTNLSKAQVSSESLKLIMSSKYFKMLQMTLGTTMALEVMGKKMDSAKKKSDKAGEETNHLSIKAMKERMKDSDNLLIKREQYLQLGKEEQGQIAKLQSLEEEKALYRSVKDPTEEDKENIQRIKKEQKEIASKMNAADSDGEGADRFDFGFEGSAGSHKSGYKKGQRKLNPDGSDMMREISTKKSGSFISSEDGSKRGGGSKLTSIGIKDKDILTPYQAWQKKWEKRKAMVRKVKDKFFTKAGLILMKDAMKNKFKGINMKAVGSFIQKGLLLMLNIAMAIAMFVIGFMVLKKMGLFTYLAMVWEGIVTWFGLVVEYVVKVIDLFMVFWDAVSAIFDGSGGEPLWKRVWTAFLALGDLLFALVIGIWIDVVWPLIKEVLIDPIIDFFMEMFGLPDNLMGWIAAAVLALVTVITLAYLAILAIPFIIAALPYLLAAALVAGIANAILGYADGGVVNSPLQVVGEKGPELINLPAGTRVHSNADSNKMLAGNGGTTNITVNVQGRIGASDTEVRDMATKVSKIINREISRSTSSATRG